MTTSGASTRTRRTCGSAAGSPTIPGPNDFLGVLLESDSSENNGHWVSAAFDQAIAEALATRDPAAAEAAFERALTEIQREVPVVPLAVSTDWALSREGLLGAGRNGMGILRMAGMAWATP